MYKPAKRILPDGAIPAAPSPDRLAAALAIPGREWLATTLGRTGLRNLHIGYIGRHRMRFTNPGYPGGHVIE
jgi:hypothetical protein